MEARTNGSIVLCPRCKVPMIYTMEAEKSGAERRITRYYKCPVCGTKIIVEKLVVRIVDGHYKVYKINTANRVIYGQQPGRHKTGPRRRAVKASTH